MRQVDYYTDNDAYTGRIGDERTHRCFRVYNPAEWGYCWMTCPKSYVNNTVYVHFLFFHTVTKQSSELGIRSKQGESHYEPFVFNTDTSHQSGWMNNSGYFWEGKRESKKRTFLSMSESDIPKYNSGDSLLLQVRNTQKETHFWVNGVYIGGVTHDFTHEYCAFGSEIWGNRDHVKIDDMLLVYYK